MASSLRSRAWHCLTAPSRRPASAGSNQVKTVFPYSLFWAGPVPAFFFGAPGRAHLLGGKSPLLARQGEELAQDKGFAGDRESEGSLVAKRWPDEQEADMRRRIGVRWPNSSKPETCTERCGVDPTGISVKVGAPYLSLIHISEPTRRTPISYA